MNEDQKLRLDLLAACGYDIKATQKRLNFVLYGNEFNKQEPDSYILADGIYLIDTTGNAVRYSSKNIENAKSIEYIGIVQGNRSLAIALHDVCEDKITLTVDKSNKVHYNYKDAYINAVQDWDGKLNTERLKQIGLNPNIQLKDDEYIPALAEMYLICLNQKIINMAMRLVGGQELEGWYYSSTESSVDNVWDLYLACGNASCCPKATNIGRIRPVKKFL